MYGAQQTSYVTLNSTSLVAEGNHINGGQGTLRGALTSPGGSARVEAYRVVAWWPDSRVADFTTNTTATQTLTGIELEAYANLFYVRLTRDSGAPSAWGELTSVY